MFQGKSTSCIYNFQKGYVIIEQDILLNLDVV